MTAWCGGHSGRRRRTMGAVAAIVCGLLLRLALPMVAQVTAIAAPGGMPLPYGVPAVEEDSIVFATESGVEARSLHDAHLLWRHPLVKNVPAALLLDGPRLLVAEAAVYALDAATGRQLWRVDPGADASLCTGTVLNGVLLVGDEARHVFAVRTADGAIMWQRQLGPAVARSRVAGVAAAGDAVYVTEELWDDPKGLRSESRLLRLDAKTGDLQWQVDGGSSGATKSPATGSQSSFTQPVMTGAGNIAVADTSQNSVQLFSSAGRLLWRRRGTPGYLGPLGPPAVLGDVMLVASGDRTLTKLRERDGEPVWTTMFAGSLIDVAVCEGAAVVSRGSLEQVDLRTGARAARSVLPAPHLITAKLVNAVDGRRVLALNGEGIYSIECSAGGEGP